MVFRKILVIFLLAFCNNLFSQLSPNLDAYGKQLYSTGSQQSIATNFSITAGGTETGQIGLYVQI